MARDERPVQVRLPRFVLGYGVLGLVGMALAPWRGPDERAMTALVVTCFAMTALWWKFLGPVAETRPLSPFGRAILPLFLIVGWVGIAVVIIWPW